MATRAKRPVIDVVALLASAGGLEALSCVLGDLPKDFPVAIVVQQHLGGQTSVLPMILGKRTPLCVSWAVDGQRVRPGQVVVCPPGYFMELRSDSSCSLTAIDAPGERRGDVLLSSLAREYGGRALAVVLSGSGRDGARGVAAMKQAGAVTIAQSPDTATYPFMAIAAMEAGAEMILPLREIGRVLIDIAEHGSSPRLHSETELSDAIFGGVGEIRGLLRKTNWAVTPLGPITRWPAEWRIRWRTMLDSGYSKAVWWGRHEMYLFEEMAAERGRKGVRRSLSALSGLPSAYGAGNDLAFTRTDVLLFRCGEQIVVVNDAFVKMSGYSQKQLHGSEKVVDLTSEEFCLAVSAALLRLSESGSTAAHDGDVIPAEESCAWALCSALVPDSCTAPARHREGVVETAGESRVSARLTEQFQCLRRAVAHRVGFDSEGMSDDVLRWQHFTEQNVDEWIGWGWMNAKIPADRECKGDTPLQLCREIGGGYGGAWVRGIPLALTDRIMYRSGGNIDLEQFSTAQETARDAAETEGGQMDSATAANYATSIRLAPSRMATSAGARAEVARRRVAELRCMREDLAAGRGATERTVATARRRAEESLRRAQQARLAAAEHAAVLSRRCPLSWLGPP